MDKMKTLACAALIVVSGDLAMAGGLEPAVMTAPVIVPVESVEPQGSSINSTVIVVGVLAALLVAAAVNANDE